MGNFLGWLSYDLKLWCDYCGKEYDAEYAHEHEDCEEDENEDEEQD